MLCGLPLPHFPRKRQRQRARPVISKPFPRDIERIDASWAPRAMSPPAYKSESGVFYLVPNPSGTGKHLVKRPRTPQTSPPLDDDFDATTQTQFGTYSMPDDRVRKYRPQPSTIPTSPRGPPISSMDTFFGGPLHASPVPLASTPAYANARSGSSTGPKASPPRPGNGTASNSSRSKGKVKQDPTADYAEYQAYMQEMGKLFGKYGELDVSLNRTKDASGTRENLTIGRVGNTTPPKSKRPGQGSNSSPPFILSKTLPPAKVNRNASTRSNEMKPPKTGLDFEEVTREVIESTPDKTVTISTWREQVAHEASNDVERMSIYYVHGGVGPELLEHAKSELDTFGAGEPSTRQPHGNLSRTLNITPPSPGSVRVLTPEDSSSRTRVQPSEFPEQSRGAPSWIRPSQFLPSSVVDALRHPPSPQPPSTSSSSSASSTSSSEFQSNSQYPPTPPPKPPKLPRLKTDPMVSTPIDPRLPIPSFHPTRDGSIISTIKSSISSQSTPYSGLEQILNSCRPSLLHLTPALAKLGINTKEHLQALLELDPDTRDRELREEALKMGITIMEWAILVNRLKSL